MPGTTEGTQNTATAGGDAGSSTTSTSTQQGSTSSGAANGTQVDGAGADGTGNSGGSDGSNGSGAGDGGRERPGRAERTITQLKRELSESSKREAEKDSLIEKLNGKPINPADVPLPDYSKMTEVTPEQIKNDVISAADKIATLRTAQAFNEFGEKLTRRDAAKQALDEIAQAKRDNKVLNEKSEDYNEDVENELGDSYKRFYDRDPTYSFLEHTELMLPGLLAKHQASNGTTSDNRNSRGQFANRSTAASKRSQKTPEDMSMDELETYIHSQNGR